MEVKEFNLITVDENNQKVIATEVEKLLDDYEEYKKNFEEAEKKFRKELLDAMINNGIINAKIGKYTISQIIPKSTMEFDENAFIEENDVDTISIFTTINESVEFDMQRFIKENPQMYYQYCVREETTNIDKDKMAKLRPDLFEKYVKEVPSDKKITLRINKSKK